MELRAAPRPYLNELDTFILNLKYNRGRKRSVNPQYQQIARQKEKLRKQLKQMGKEGAEVGSRRPLHDTLNELTRQQRSIPSGNPGDPTYRRLWLCRYADDLLIGLIGPKQEAQAIKDQVQTFLRDELKLELAAEKTGIRHAKTEGATFLGYNVKMADSQKELKVKIHGSYVTKRTNRGTPTLGVPLEKVRKFCQAKGYGHWQTLKSCHRPELLGLSDAEIIHTFNAELRGFANFYALAKDVKSKLHRLFFLAHSSFVKTLAAKYRMKQSEILTKYRTGADLTVICETPGKAKILKLFKLSELKTIPRRYGEIDKWPNTFAFQSTNELLNRWHAQECEICGKTTGYFEIHHIRKLKDLKDGKQNWQIRMAARKRKTLVLCVECHDLLHAGRLPDWRFRRK